MKLLFLLAALFFGVNSLADFYQPPKGFVPTQEVAIKIAEAVLVPIYGKDVLEEKPWKVTENDGRWFIDGTLHAPKGKDVSLEKPKQIPRDYGRELHEPAPQKQKIKGPMIFGGAVHIEIDKMTGAISHVIHYQ